MAKCPERLFHKEPHSIKGIADDLYRCACGCLFKWTHDFEWEVINQRITPWGGLKRTSAEVSIIEKWLAKRGYFTKHYPADSLYARMNKSLLHFHLGNVLVIRVAFAWGWDDWGFKRLGKEIDSPKNVRYNGLRLRVPVRGYDLIISLRLPWRDVHYLTLKEEDPSDQSV